MSSPEVVVVGAGVVGLTTALLLQEQSPNSKITVIADSFELDTVSSVAAGIFRPGTNFRAKTIDLTRMWINDSWQYWNKILKSEEAVLAGVIQLSVYLFSNDHPNIVKNHLIEDLVPVYREATNNELSKLCGGGWKYGAFFTTVKIDCTRYLPWARKKFILQGGRIEKRKIDSFSELDKKYDLIFNCSGLGSKQLCGDHDLTPLRGQIIKVKAPWIKMAYYHDYDTYIIPGMDGTVTLGGTRQYDSYNTSPCKHDQAAILERCVQLIPALANAEIVDVRVGLRPHRSPVRVEMEIGSLKTPIVHCYGHGGYGVTCAPGTAKYAVELGLQYLQTKHKL